MNLKKKLVRSLDVHKGVFSCPYEVSLVCRTYQVENASYTRFDVASNLYK